jgi:putative heme degradation protein
LVNIQKVIEAMAIDRNSEFSHEKHGDFFHGHVNVYQRVIVV